jgi:predicted permease
MKTGSFLSWLIAAVFAIAAGFLIWFLAMTFTRHYAARTWVATPAAVNTTM